MEIVEKSKNNLWIFGDSMSAPFEDAIHSLWFKFYIQELKVDKFLFWQEIVADRLNLNLVDNGVGGFDNYSIFETFCKNSIHIKKGDYVVLNWSHINRFRVPIDEDRFTRILPGGIDPELLKNKFFTETELNKITVNRDHKLFQQEVDNWSLFINEFCKIKKVKILFWGICEHRPYFFIDHGKFKTLSYKNTINDHFTHLEDKHFSVYGHQNFAKEVIYFLQNLKLINYKPF